MSKKSIFKPKNENASAMHRHVWQLVNELYGGMKLLEEQNVPVVIGGSRTTLFVDIVVKDLRVAIECNGRQHSQFVPHFHGSRQKFEDGLKRDAAKRQAVEAAGYVLIIIYHDEWEKLTAKQLGKMIIKALKEST